MMGTGVRLNCILIFFNTCLAVFPLDLARAIELILLHKTLTKTLYAKTALACAVEIAKWPFTGK